MRVPLLMEQEIAGHLAQVPGWARVGEAITRTYRLAGFRAAIAFVGRVADAAEDADHHPDIDVRYRNVTLLLTTHDSCGLTRLDFKLAAQALLIAGATPIPLLAPLRLQIIVPYHPQSLLINR